MPNEKSNKSRILFLKSYLEDYTDDEHFITTNEIISLCKENGFNSSRSTVTNDIATLKATGYEVRVRQVARNRTKTNAYYRGPRLFTLDDLKILVNVVSSTASISEEESEKLIEKLSRLTIAENREKLVPVIFTVKRKKISNDDENQEKLEKLEVTLLCKNEFMGDIIDRFGEQVETKIVDQYHFEAIGTTAPSDEFFGWVFKYGGGIQIIGPVEVEQAYKELIQQALKKQKSL